MGEIIIAKSKRNQNPEGVKLL